MQNTENDSYRPSDTERINKVKIYDNDEAYMLNDDKDNNDISIEELEMENDDLNAARGSYHEVKDLSDDETIRKEQNEEEKERKSLLIKNYHKITCSD
jgi:hypothetical protein